MLNHYTTGPRRQPVGLRYPTFLIVCGMGGFVNSILRAIFGDGGGRSAYGIGHTGAAILYSWRQQ